MSANGGPVHEQRDLLYVAISRTLSTPLFIALTLIAGDDLSTALLAVLAVGWTYTWVALAIASSRRWERLDPRLLAATDLVALGVIMALSGGPESQVVIVYFLWPIGMSLTFPPREVAFWLLAAMASYLAVALPFVAGEPFSLDTPDLRDLIAHELALAWIGATTVGTSYALARRRERLERLSAVRRHLLADAIGAEDRTQRRVFQRVQEETLEVLLVADQDLDAAARAGGVDGARRIERARARVRLAVRQVRELVRELHPATLRVGGLAAGLDATVERAVGERPVLADVRVDPAAGGANDGLLISVARELADNAIRHARAKRISLGVRAGADEVVMEFTDDGVGLAAEAEAEALERGAVGLASCRARTEAAGGRFELSASPGGGTRAVVAVPSQAAVGSDTAQRYEPGELVYTAAVRALTLPLFLALLVVAQEAISGTLAWLLVLASILLPAQVLYFSTERGGRLDPRPWIVFDLAALAAMTAASGGPQSEVTIVYFIWPLAMALLYPPRLVILCACAAMLVFAAVSAPFVAGDPLSLDQPELRALALAEVSLAWIGSVTLAAALAFDRRRRRIESLSEARLRVLLETLEAEEEARRRLSQALHDDALQVLLAAGQDLDAALAGSVPALEKGREELQLAVRRLRLTAQGLHPAGVAEDGLAAGLDAAADRAAQLGGLEVEAEAAARSGPHDALIVALARELATNTAKHAGARRLSIQVREQTGAVILRVTDDGCGVTQEQIAAAIANGHIGLASCIERAEAAGGTLLVTAGEPRGTIVTVELPTAPAASAL